MIVDLRTPVEYMRDPIPNAIHVPIPLPPLGPADVCDATVRLFRHVPRGPRVGIACAKGIRSALATAILSQAGYNVINLGGMRDPLMRRVILQQASAALQPVRWA